MPSTRATSPEGMRGKNRLIRKMMTRAETPTTAVYGLISEAFVMTLIELLREIPLAGGQPEKLGNLANRNDQRQAEDEAGDHRLGEEV